MASDDRRTAPYLPFKTFINALESLAPHVPDVIDRGIWDTQSGAMQSAIMGSLRFLGLIEPNDKPTVYLRKMVDDPGTRPAVLGECLRRAYPDLFALSLVRATPKQVDEVISVSYNVSGATLQKSVTFFIQAAGFCQIPLSSYLTRRKMRMAARRRNVKTRIIDGDLDLEIPGLKEEKLQTDTAKSRVVQLKSGGEVAVSMNFDPFTLSQTDRAFLFGLIDKLTEYENGVPEKSTPQSRPSMSAQKVADTFDQGITDDDVPF